MQKSDLKIQINTVENFVGANKGCKTFMFLFCILVNLQQI